MVGGGDPGDDATGEVSLVSRAGEVSGLWSPVAVRRVSPPSLLAGARVTQVALRVLGQAGHTVTPQIEVEVPAALAGAAVRRRVEDVLAGRACAQLALHEAGAGSLSVGARPDRAPIWPEGWTGSITHAAGVVWAAVARSADLASLGIDAEALMTPGSAEDVRALALTTSERERGALLVPPGEAAPATLAATLIFSAKESIFKCLNPLVKEFIDFTDMELSAVDAAARKVEFVSQRRLSSRFARGMRISVGFSWVGELVFTATAWPQ